MNLKLKGAIGEARVLCYFIENEYEVYIPYQGNGIYDLIVMKHGILQKVSIKYTSQKTKAGSYYVELRNVSRRKDNKVAVKKFDCASVDLLAVYIQPVDKVVILTASSVKSKVGLTINMES